MPDNEEIWQEIRDEFQSGNTDPFISDEAKDALSEAWQDTGYDDLGVIFESFGIDDPGAIDSVTVEFSDDSWSLEFSDGTSIDLGDEVPDWVWDELYDFADEMEWDWDVDYGED